MWQVQGTRLPAEPPNRLTWLVMAPVLWSDTARPAVLTSTRCTYTGGRAALGGAGARRAWHSSAAGAGGGQAGR